MQTFLNLGHPLLQFYGRSGCMRDDCALEITANDTPMSFVLSGNSLGNKLMKPLLFLKEMSNKLAFVTEFR